MILSSSYYATIVGLGHSQEKHRASAADDWWIGVGACQICYLSEAAS
jgi:hypothetical protein